MTLESSLSSGHGVASGGVGFDFLRGTTITVLASYRFVGTVGAGLGVGFVLLLGVAIVILASFMAVRAVGVRLFDRGCIARVKAMNTSAGVFGADSSSVFGSVICSPVLASFSRILIISVRVWMDRGKRWKVNGRYI